MISNRVSKWWAAPRKTTEFIEDRKVSFIELFYDLAYIAFLSRIGHSFAANISWQGLTSFFLLFIIGWWGWLNGISYHDRHANDDIRSRVFIFLQMFFVIFMSIFSHHAIGKDSTYFILSFIGLQCVITYLWWHTGVIDKDYKPISDIYSTVYCISILLLISSIFMDESIKYFIWLISSLGSLIMALILFDLKTKRDVRFRHIMEGVTLSEAFLERFSLFTIIVIGEIIFSVVGGVSSSHHFSLQSFYVMVCCMFIATGIWSLYFDFVAENLPSDSNSENYVWLYLHVPLKICITLIGAILLHFVEFETYIVDFKYKFLLVSFISMIMIVTGLLNTFSKSTSKNRINNKRIFVVGILTMFLIPLNLNIYMLLIMVVFMLYIPHISYLVENVFMTKDESLTLQGE